MYTEQSYLECIQLIYYFKCLKMNCKNKLDSFSFFNFKVNSGLHLYNLQVKVGRTCSSIRVWIFLDLELQTCNYMLWILNKIRSHFLDIRLITFLPIKMYSKRNWFIISKLLCVISNASLAFHIIIDIAVLLNCK